MIRKWRNQKENLKRVVKNLILRPVARKIMHTTYIYVVFKLFYIFEVKKSFKKKKLEYFFIGSEYP